MSGFAYNLKITTALTPVAYVHTQEAAGKVGNILGIVAAVVMPFAAPAIFGAIAGSGVLGAGLAAAATGGTLSTMATVIGSAAVGAIANAGIAYASGARGGDVWRAAGMGALSGGAGGLARGPMTAAVSKTTGATGPMSTMGKVATNVWGDTVNAAGQAVQTASTAAGTVSTASGGIMNGIRTFFGNTLQGVDLNRVSAALINAAVNGQSMGRLDGLVAQQRAELQALQQQDAAAYAQRIQAAQQILADADKMDPAWMARTRMADVAGIEANQFRQAMRNIATRQGGSLDIGQRKAYERSAALHTARSKALAWGEGWQQGVTGQATLRAQGAGLMTGPNFQPWEAETELLAGQERARREAANSTWGGLTGAFMERNVPQATSPDPSAQNDEDTSFGGIQLPDWARRG